MTIQSSYWGQMSSMGGPHLSGFLDLMNAHE